MKRTTYDGFTCSSHAARNSPVYGLGSAMYASNYSRLAGYVSHQEMSLSLSSCPRAT